VASSNSVLNEYNDKRKFTDTPEPRGITNKKSAAESKLKSFVVQKHKASHLHYDFRLEDENGVLKSWAVPKGPSMDSRIKRLAVLTEDHPYDYLLFEGTIPRGNYGAGTVIVWDHGTYKTDDTLIDQFQKGKISIELHGQKLRGRFSLVKTKNDKQWLLIKANDEFMNTDDLTVTSPSSVLSGRSNADLEQDSNSGKVQKRATTGKRTNNNNKSLSKVKNKKDVSSSADKAPTNRTHITEELPSMIKPMLASPVDKAFNNKDWVFEIKWDGVRAIMFKENHAIRFQSRNGNDITHKYPEILKALELNWADVNSTIIDGEIVVLDKNGVPNFQGHQRRMNIQNNREIEILSKEIPATYYVFDILYHNGKDIKRSSYLERRQILSQILPINDRVKISDYVEEKGLDLWKHTRELNLEGVVAKRKASVYQAGIRSRDWLKVKSIITQDCVVVGYTKGLGNRERYFGSLLMAVYDSSQKEFRFVGHTGSGFDYKTIDITHSRLQKLITNSMPIDHLPYMNRPTTWVKPVLVAEVKFAGWTKEGIMRAPIFLRLREDKNPEDCVIRADQPVAIKSDIEGDEYIEHALPSVKVDLSNLDKVYWKATGDHGIITKGDLINYYDSMSSLVLPHLKDRPLSLSRYPDGVDGKSFYQKDWNHSKPEYVKTVRVHSEHRGEVINYLICNNRESLLWIVNLGAIEMHPWYSRIKDFDSCDSSSLLYEEKCGLTFPDFIVFDLDPYIYSGTEKKGKEPEYNLKGFRATVEVAYHLRDLLMELKIKSFVKTSGKTGLHIYVPITQQYTYDQTRTFAEIIGKTIISRFPKKVTMEWNTTKRKGKVFFDYNQNSRGKTIASVYSLRPTMSAIVSMPVSWNKLADITPTDFTIKTVSNLTRGKRDEWEGVLKDKQDLGKILSAVKEMMV
jgi:bifunctional non-homologous end joining protein LigD